MLVGHPEVQGGRRAPKARGRETFMSAQEHVYGVRVVIEGHLIRRLPDNLTLDA